MPGMTQGSYWVLLVFALLIGAAYYLPVLRRRQRDRRRDQERLDRSPTQAPPTDIGTKVDEPPAPRTRPAPPVRPAPPEKPAAQPQPQPTPEPAPEAPPAPVVEPPVVEPEAEVEPEPEPEVEPEVVLERPEPTAGRLVRLRARLSRSQNAFGGGLLSFLSRDKLEEDTWEEIEDTLITADVGVEPTRAIVERLRERARVLGTGSADDLRGLLAE